MKARHYLQLHTYENLMIKGTEFKQQNLDGRNYGNSISFYTTRNKHESLYYACKYSTIVYVEWMRSRRLPISAKRIRMFV